MVTIKKITVISCFLAIFLTLTASWRIDGMHKLGDGAKKSKEDNTMHISCMALGAFGCFNALYNRQKNTLWIPELIVSSVLIATALGVGMKKMPEKAENYSLGAFSLLTGVKSLAFLTGKIPASGDMKIEAAKLIGPLAILFLI